MKKSITMIGDFGKDLDDENALLYAVGAQLNNEVELSGVVANLVPSDERARLARGMLDLMGRDTPVAVGTSCNVTDKTYGYEMDVPYLARKAPDIRGLDLLSGILDASPDRSQTLVLNSGLTDTADLIEQYPALVKAKVRRVAIMGGVCVVGDEVDFNGRGRMVPDQAANNMFDKDASDFTYDWLQAEGVPLTVVSKEAAYGCRFHFSFYDELAATGNPIGIKIRDRQRPALEKLWREANAEPGSELRGSLPERCDRQWFVGTFLDGHEPGEVEEIWEQASGVGKFQLYDSLNVAAVTRPEYFGPELVTVGGVEHQVIGVSKNKTGIKDEAGLRAHVRSRELEALRLPLHSY